MEYIRHDNNLNSKGVLYPNVACLSGYYCKDRKNRIEHQS